jgi:hypothetical protein
LPNWDIGQRYDRICLLLQKHSNSFFLFSMRFFLFSYALFISLSSANVTVYYTGGQLPMQTPAPINQAYNPIVLTPPPVPSPAPSTTFAIQVQNGNYTGLSIPQRGSFFGFSLEFAVASQIGEYLLPLYSPR